jgi:hypothetical protein
VDAQKLTVAEDKESLLLVSRLEAIRQEAFNERCIEFKPCGWDRIPRDPRKALYREIRKLLGKVFRA